MSTVTNGLAVLVIGPTPWKQRRALGSGGTRALGDPVKANLTGLITRKYALDEINDGYQDLMDGKNIRGVVVHSGS